MDSVAEDLRERLKAAAQSPNTRLAYDKAWRRYERWCAARQPPLDPLAASEDHVVEFLSAIGTEPSAGSGRLLSVATVSLCRCGIHRRFVAAGRADTSPAGGPRAKEVVAALERVRGAAPRQVKALREDDMAAMLDQCPDSAIGRRDGALLALGFAAALRRSELVALRVDDLEFAGEGKLVVRIRRSKTDQRGRGQSVAVPEADGSAIRPVARLREWIETAGIAGDGPGPAFRPLTRGGRAKRARLHHSDVARLVKRYAGLAGLDPREYSAHSLRAGFVTSAAAHHARLDKIMEVTRHRSPQMVLRYIRDADAFEDHAGAGFL